MNDNIFNTLGLPNMDTVCTAVVDGSSTVTTCSDPWVYRKTYALDIILVVLVVALLLPAFIKRR